MIDYPASMSMYRQQALIDVPVTAVWELVADVNRHPEWWPRVLEVECDGLEAGCTYRQVFESPKGIIETEVSVESLEDCRELTVRCINTGTYTRWLLTDVQGGTFVDAEFGVDPQTIGTRIFDVVAGKRFFRRWLEQSLDALENVAGERSTQRGRLPETAREQTNQDQPSTLE